ncbi:hypothetical protein GJQ54_13295 [Oceanospirillaceae bacterium ASx5O]|nr:hypothetical protein GJQ54_13295 [Oceanospirillaceae bacterium ASx5O]
MVAKNPPQKKPQVIATVITSLLLMVMASQSQADNGRLIRNGYSYLGAGIEFIDYKETDDDLLGTGLSLETETTASPLTQRSGGFVAHESGWGFYIQTEASIGNNTNHESWSIEGTKVQEDSFSLRRSELRVLVAAPVFSSQSFLFGAAVQDASFTRFDWSLTDQALYKIDATAGSVSEEMFKIFAYAGYEFGHFFIDGDTGWNWQVQLLAGIPLYSQTLNTGLGNETINGGFDGYRLETDAAIGYRFSENFMLGVSLKIAHEAQQEIESDLNITTSSGTTTVKRALPENTFLITQPALTFYWSF